MRRSNFAKKSVVRKKVPSFQASLNEASLAWLFEADGSPPPVGTFPDVGKKLPVGKQTYNDTNIKGKLEDLIEPLTEKFANWKPEVPPMTDRMSRDSIPDEYKKFKLDDWKKQRIELTDDLKKKILNLVTYTKARNDFFYKDYENLAKMIITFLRDYEVNREVVAPAINRETNRWVDVSGGYLKQQTYNIPENKVFSNESINDLKKILEYLDDDWVEFKEADDEDDSLSDKAKEILGGRNKFLRNFVAALKRFGFEDLSQAMNAGIYTKMREVARQVNNLGDDRSKAQFKKNLMAIDGMITTVLCLSNFFNNILDIHAEDLTVEDGDETLKDFFTNQAEVLDLLRKHFVMDKTLAKKLNSMYLDYYGGGGVFESFKSHSSELLSEISRSTFVSEADPSRGEWTDDEEGWYDDSDVERYDEPDLSPEPKPAKPGSLGDQAARAFERIRNLWNNSSGERVLKNTKPLFNGKELQNLLFNDFEKVKRSNFVKFTTYMNKISKELVTPNSATAKIVSGETAGTAGGGSPTGGAASAGGGRSAGGESGGAAGSGGGESGGAAGSGGGGRSGGGGGGGGAAGATSSSGAGSSKSLASILGIEVGDARKVLDDLKSKTTIGISGDAITSLDPDKQDKLKNALADPERDLRTSLGKTFTESKQRNSGVIVERWQQLAGLIK